MSLPFHLPAKTKREGSRTVVEAFTLMELLVVMAVIGVIATLVIPPATNLVAAQRLTVAGSELAAQFAVARQTAVSSGVPVEVRVYELAADEGFCAWRLVRITNETDQNGQLVTEGLTALKRFPAGVTAVSGVPYSTILSDPQQVAGSPGEVLPGEDIETPYRAVRFLPNGQADLSPAGAAGGAAWTLTLADPKHENGFSESQTPNCVVLVVEPLTGATQSIRP